MDLGRILRGLETVKIGSRKRKVVGESRYIDEQQQ